MKPPTLAALRKAARRHGEGTIVNVMRDSGTRWWIAWVSFEEGETVECVAPNRGQAQTMLLACLRALAPKPKKRGRK